MAKPSAYLVQLREQRLQDMNYQRLFTIQQCKDVAVITLNEFFGFGAERCNLFLTEFSNALEEWIQLSLQDNKDDKDIDYTKGKMDARLTQILGDGVKPFEERYPNYFGDQSGRNKK